MSLKLRLSTLNSSLNLDQYAGLWAMEETRFSNILHNVHAMDLELHVKNQDEEEEPKAHYRVMRLSTDGELFGQTAQIPRGSRVVNIAVIEVNGVLMKRGTSLAASSSLIRLRQAVRAAARDGEIQSILIRGDTPGGTVSGTADFAAEVLTANQAKPVFWFIEDLTASAGYWAATQARRIYANNASAEAGSIGTYLGLYDLSAYAEKEGIRPVVIRTGDFKGAGFPGAAITPEQEEYWQGIVNDTQQLFSNAVAKGRGLSRAKVDALADGRAFMAEDAIEKGLIDGIKTFDQTLAELAREATITQSGKKRQTMSATLAELKARFPQAGAEFYVAQIEAEASIDDAAKAWETEQANQVAKLKADAEKAQKAAEEAKAEAETAKAENDKLRKNQKSIGNDPTDGTGKASESTELAEPIVAWNAAVDDKLKTGLKKPDAVRALAKEQPDLHAAYVQAHNEEVGPSTYRGERA